MPDTALGPRETKIINPHLFSLTEEVRCTLLCGAAMVTMGIEVPRDLGSERWGWGGRKKVVRR